MPAGTVLRSFSLSLSYPSIRSGQAPLCPFLLSSSLTVTPSDAFLIIFYILLLLGFPRFVACFPRLHTPRTRLIVSNMRAAHITHPSSITSAHVRIILATQTVPART